MAEPVPADATSTVLIFLGPAAVAALIAALVWWLRNRPPKE